MLVLMLVLGCVSPRSTPVEEAAASTPTATRPAVPMEPGGNDKGCIRRCVESRRMESLSVELIETQCTQRCATGDPFVVRAQKDASKLAGARVAVEGKLIRAELDGAPGTALELSDGSLVWITYTVPPHGWEGLVDQPVRVVGTLTGGPPEGKTGPAGPHLFDADAPIPMERAVEEPSSGDTAEPGPP